MSLEALESRLVLSTIVWSGAGDDTTWNSPANWVGNVVPGPSDDASIQVGSGVTIQLPLGGITVNSVTQTNGTLETATTGTITTANGLSLTNCTFDDNGGSIVGGVTLQGNSTLNGSSSAGAASFIIAGFTTLEGTITATQTVRVDGGEDGGNTFLELSANSANLGTIEVQATSDETSSGLIVASGMTFINAGTIEFNASSGSNTLTGNLVNQGTIDVAATNLTLDRSGTTLVNLTGGLINASGTIDDSEAAFINNGILSIDDGMAAALTINGTYIQGAAGALDLELGGTTAGTLYDQLNVTGAATLNGALNISLINGYLPSNNSSFDVLNYDSVSGSFATYNGTDLTNNSILQPSPTSTSLTLTDEFDLQISLTPPAPITTNGQISFTGSISYIGPDVVALPTFIDTFTLPQGATLSTDTGGFSISDNTITSDFGSGATDGFSTPFTVIVKTTTVDGSYGESASLSSSNFGSISATLGPTPVQELVSLALASSPISPVQKQPVTLNATASVPAGFVAPSGIVTFSEGTLVLGMAQVDASGVATLVVPFLPLGSDVISATYGSDPIYAPISTPVTTTVKVRENSQTLDFDGDGKADPAVFDPSTATFSILESSTETTVTKQFGIVGDIPVPEDYDGDGKTDIAVFRPSTDTFFVLDSSTGAVTTKQFGTAGDIPVPADYDGDGKADIAVYRPSDATFFILDSSTGTVTTRQFGMTGDIPVPEDYDGDGKTDLAVFRPSTDTFFVLDSSTGTVENQPLGTSGDIPVPADYDGDGKVDFAVFRPSTDIFFIVDSSTDTLVARQFGAVGDIPAPADYDGEGKADFGVFQPSRSIFTRLIIDSTGQPLNQTILLGAVGDEALPAEKYLPVPGDSVGDDQTDLVVFRPSTATFLAEDPPTGSVVTTQFGIAGDVPLSGDFDGDRKADIAIYRPMTSTFFIIDSSTGAVVNRQFGIAGDVPVPGDYLGDGKTDIAVFRPSDSTFFILDSEINTVVTRQFGTSGDVPVPGDYLGTGQTDIAVFRPSTATFFILDPSTGAVTTRQLGIAGDVPVPGDYLGDGKTDIAVYRPSTNTYFILNPSTGAVETIQFGIAGDDPVPGAYLGDGQTDIAVYRPSTNTFFILDSLTGKATAIRLGISDDVPLQAPNQ